MSILFNKVDGVPRSVDFGHRSNQKELSVKASITSRLLCSRSTMLSKPITGIASWQEIRLLSLVLI